MTRIIQGVLDFQERVFGEKRELFEGLRQGQKPLALFITCSDSRVEPGLLAQTQPGELFILRNAGNIVPPYSAGPWAEAATIEYAVANLKVRDIILCGHSRCGAMGGLLKPDDLAALPTVAAWLALAKDVLPRLPDDLTDAEARLIRAIQENVLVQLEHLKTHPAVREALAARELRLHGWVYHFETGQVESYDPISGKFGPLDKQVRQKWVQKVEENQAPRPESDVNT